MSQAKLLLFLFIDESRQNSIEVNSKYRLYI